MTTALQTVAVCVKEMLISAKVNYTPKKTALTRKAELLSGLATIFLRKHLWVWGRGQVQGFCGTGMRPRRSSGHHGVSKRSQCLPV